jgi:multiple sugar transport system permease protein
LDHYLGQTLKRAQLLRVEAFRRSASASHHWQLGLLLTPYLIGLLVLTLAPMLMTIALSFADYDIFSPPVWNDFANFKHFFVDKRFLLSLSNSLWFVLGAVSLRLSGALLLALLLNHPTRLHEFTRAIIYLPLLMPEVAYAFVWQLLLNPSYGPINLVLGALGVSPQPWLQIEWSARLTLIVMFAFELGEGFVLLLAARQTISPEVVEAAALDGGSRWDHFWHIYLPLLTPALLLLACRDTALSFQNAFVAGMITTETGPYYATYFLSHYLFNEAFGLFKYGYGAALTVCIYVVTTLLIGLQFLVLRDGGRPDEI